jgi:poly(glycerol-phosphate) alpha-glucosyltransferase
MKIVFSLDYISRLNTGVSTVVNNLSTNFTYKNHEIYIATCFDRFTLEDTKNYNIKELYFIKNKNYFLVFFKYFKFYNKTKADLIHIQSFWSISTIAAYFWAIINNKPYIISTNGMINKWALNQSKFKKKLALKFIFKKILRSANTIIVNSSIEKSFIIKSNFNKNAFVIPNGVVLPIEKSCNSKQKNKVLLFLSRIHPKKGVDLLIDAWKELTIEKKVNNWTLKLVGFNLDSINSYENEILHKITYTNNLNNIQFSNGVYGDKMWDEYINSDAFILPTFSEGSAIAVLNAWSCNKIVLTNIESNLEYGLNEKCTILFENNMQSIKNSICILLNMNDSDRENFGNLGRGIIQKYYDWNIISDKYLDIYFKTLEIKK